MAADRTPRAPHEQYRLADIPVDDAWVRKHNESLAEVRRLQWSAGILGVLVLAAAVGLLIYSGFEAWPGSSPRWPGSSLSDAWR